MNYCVDFCKDFKYINDVDEITITFNRKDTTLVDFLLEHQTQRINIWIKDAEDFLENKDLEKFKAIQEKYPDLIFYFKLPDPDRSNQRDSIKKLHKLIEEETSFPYFFDTFVNNWDTLYGYLHKGVSDMYITESLGFELNKVAKVLHDAGIRIRTFPNVCQTACKEIPSLKTFFIRPEDVIYYEDYVDTLEFFGYKNSIETVYKVYAIDKKWFGQLKELILGFNEDFDSRYIIPRFAEKRIRCGKECLKGGYCRICERVKDLSKVLEKNSLLIKTLEDN